MAINYNGQAQTKWGLHKVGRTGQSGDWGHGGAKQKVVG